MSNVNIIELGDKIRILREAKKETQDDLKKILGFKNRQQVSYIERGERAPTIHQIYILAKHFNVSTDYLLGLSSVPTVDRDLQFVCDYTGLSENTIKFFASTKSTNDNLSFYYDFISFIEFFISEVNYYSAYSVDFTALREETTSCAAFYMEVIEDRKPLFVNITNKEAERIQEDINSKVENLPDKGLPFTASAYGDRIKACKYHLTTYFSNLLDKFSVSKIDNLTIEDFQKLEVEAFNRVYGLRY